MKNCIGNVGFILNKVKIKINKNIDKDKGEILVKTPTYKNVRKINFTKDGLKLEI